MPATHAFVHATSAAMWLQTTDFNSAENTHLLMIFLGILAVSIAVIALAVIVVAFVVAKAVKRLLQITEELKAKSMPIIGSTQGIITTVQGVVHDLQPKIKTVTDDLTPKIKTITDDLTPKIKTISTNVTEMSTIARDNVAKFDSTLNSANNTVKEVNEKARAQVDRVDGMVSSALTATSNVAQTIHHSIRIPVNQVAGVVSGFKAGLDVLLGAARDLQRSAPAKDAGKGISLEAKREEDMERVAKPYTGGGSQPTSAVPTGIGSDILGGSSVEGTPVVQEMTAGQRRAAELRGAPDASDLSEPGKPMLPKRFQ